MSWEPGPESCVGWSGLWQTLTLRGSICWWTCEGRLSSVY